MELILLLSAGSCFQKQAYLSLVDFYYSFNLFSGEMIYSTFLWLLPTQNVIRLSTDRIWLIIWIKEQILELELLRRFIWNRCGVFLQFPFLQAKIRKSEDLVFDFWIEDDFIEIFSFIDNLSDLFSSILADDVDGTEVNLSVSLIVDVLQLGDGVCSWIFLLTLFDWIDFNHLVRSLPKDVDSWIVINWHDDSQLYVFLITFFISWELQSWYFVCLNNFSEFVNFPAVKKFDFLFLQIGSDYCNVVIVSMNTFDNWFQFITLHNFWVLNINDVKSRHSKNHCKIFI